MANRFLSNITINDSYTLPSADGANGQVIGTDGAGNLSFVDQTTEALTLNVTVKNISGVSLAKGTIVHAQPSANPPSGNVVEVIAADYDTSASMPAIGVLNETLADEAEGQAIMFGAVSGIDTSSFSAGDELWVGNNGAFTNTKPATAGQLIQKIAVVIKSHVSNGLIKIFGAGRTNDVPLPLYIDNTNQRVGIGTTSPNAKLEVNGSADSIITSLDHTAFSGRQVGLPGRFMVGPLGNGYPQIGYNFTTANSAYTKIANDTAWAIGFGEGNRMTFKYVGAGIGTFSWSELMSISNTGKIGIGNTSPEADIHIGTNDGTRRIVLQGANSAANSSELIFGDSNIDAPRYAGMGVRYNSDDNHLTIRSFFDGANSADTEIARFDRTTLDSTFQGKVGIGTLTPGAKLHVNGGTGENTTKVIIGGNDAILRLGDNQGGGPHGFQFDGYQTTDGMSIYYRTTPQQISFEDSTGISGNKIMVVGRDGSVGIGTTSPSETLQVQGNIRIAPTGSALLFDTTGGDGSNGIKTINDYETVVYNGRGAAGFAVIGNSSIRIGFGTSYTAAQSSIYIPSSGNVGIGTNSPSQKLHIKSGSLRINNSVGNTAYITLNENDTDENIVLEYDGTNTGAGNYFSIHSNVSGWVGKGSGFNYIPSNGRVGIGTTSPDRQFEIENSGDAWFRLKGNGAYFDFLMDGNLRMFNSGGERMRIASTGNVGIGTTSPSGNLTIKGANDANLLVLENTLGGTSAKFQISENNGLYISSYEGTTNRHIVFNTGVTERMRISANGEVSIGTSTALLTGGSRGNLTINGSAESILTLGIGGTWKSYYFVNSSATYLASSSGTPLIFEAGGTEKMRINSSGNVGIGETSPAAKLVVRDGSGLGSTAGDYKFLAQFRGENVNQSYIEIKDVRTATGSDWTTAGMRIQGRIDSTYMGYMQFNGSGNNSGISFGTGTTTTAPGNVTERMRITSSGSVGINTTSPQAKLDVKGGILTRNTRVDVSQAHPVGHYNEGEQVFGIDPTWSQSELQQFFNSSNVTWNADSTAPGGYAIYINGGVNVGGVYSSGFPYIPVDQDDYFYMEVWIKNAGSGQTHYMGSNEFNHGFVSLGGHPGSYGYWVMSNTNPGSSWTKVSGYIGGFSASTVGTFENGTKYWTPMALFNYGAGSGTRACYISGWKVFRVTQHGRRKFTDSVGVLGGSYSASVDSVSDAGLVVKQGRAIYSLANSDQYLRNLIQHNSANHIIIGQLGTSLIADVFVYTGSSGNFRVYTNGTETMRLASDAKLHVENDIIAFSTTVSDARLKDDVVTIDSALDKIKALRGVEYVWNKGGREGQKDLGFIAQEVEQVIPEIVRENEMPLLDDSGEQYKTVDYEKVVAVLVEAVKEQQKQIEELKVLINNK